MPRVTKERNTRVIKQLYDVQHRRCAVCDLEMPHKNAKGHLTQKCEHKPSGLVMCGKCNHLVNIIRKVDPQSLDRARKLIEMEI